MIYDGTGSVEAGTWYLVVLGQKKVVLVDTCWYWVSRRQYCLGLGGTGPAWCGTDWYLVVLSQYRAALVDTL